MSELNPKGSKDKKRTFFLVLLGLVIFGLACACGAALFAFPAFEQFVNRSKAVEAESSVKKIAIGARAHFESSPDCSFPEPAGPLPALMDCCADTCRRTEAQMNEPGWQQVGFDTSQMYRFTYETESNEERFVVRASADFDCDDTKSTYAIEVRATNRSPGACEATIGESIIEQPLE